MGLHLDAATNMPKETEDVVTLEGDNPAIVHQMLGSCYSPDYGDEFPPHPTPFRIQRWGLRPRRQVPHQIHQGYRQVQGLEALA